MSASEIQVGGTHYKDMGDFQPWDVLKHWLTPEEYRGYQKGVAIAYLARERAKGGNQDIAKAVHHLQKLLEVVAEADAVVIPPPPEYDPASVAFAGGGRLSFDADWSRWEGGPCPYPPGAVVHVRLKDGSEHVREAVCFNWNYCGRPSDIIACRVVGHS